ncbi:MAG: DUF1573 domain-containing protein [Cyclobacteriaceae bacterium]
MRFLVYVCLTLILNFTFAQGSLKFEKETHDFGEIKEEAGYAEFTFSFVNTSEQPVKITNVRASCGCTTPGWTKEAVMPGDSGFIKARYNPRNRPGNFRKSLTISASPSTGNKTLYIKGYVKPKPKSVLEELPVSAGDLRLKFRSLNMGRMTTEKAITKDFDVYNNGKDSLRLQYNVMEVPTHITLTMEPELLGPGQQGVLKLTYDPVKKNDLGFISDNFTLQTDTAITVKNEFNVLTTIEEFFPEMTPADFDSAPKLLIAERVFDFGQVKEGEVVETEFTLSNEGKKKLNFRKIKSNCSCVTYEIKSQNMKRGKSQVLKVLFDTSGRKGNQYKTVTIFSNDPSAPTQMVTIKGKVTKTEDSK